MRAAEVMDEASELLRKAARCYRRISALVDGLGAIIPQDFPDASVSALRDLESRRRYADLVRDICDIESEAVANIESAI